MRKLFVVALLCLLPKLLLAQIYSTSFPLTENPISEGGSRWINGSVSGVWPNVRTTTGFAFGTQTGSDDVDSTEVLTGTWGIAQSAQGVVSVNATDPAGNEEVEIRLHTSISPSSITGYEINCSTASNYLQVVRWNGPFGNFTQLGSTYTGASPLCVNGTVLKATYDHSGVIRAYLNGALVLTAPADTTYQNSGSPGIGFWLNGLPSGDNAHFGFSSYTATGSNTLWSGIIDPSRAVDWTGAGSPAVTSSASWTQCGSTVPAGSSAATINAAIAGCTANHYVQLAAGTFNIGNPGITFVQKNNVKLTGAGANQTFLVFSATNGCQGFVSGICMASADLNYVLSQSNTANWTAGYLPGTTLITLSSKTNLAVGNPIVLDQTDDTTDSGDVLVCYQDSPLTCSTNGDNGGFARTNRGQQQIVTVTSIAGSGPYVVGITPGIYMPNWTSTKTPQAWWATTPISNMGVENLSIDMTSSGETGGTGFGIEIFNCSGCWVKGIRGIQPGRSHVQAQVATNITVQDSYFYRTVSQTSSSYGVEAAGASAMLIQNNIFQQVTEPMSLNGNCSGCVEGFNFDIDDIYDSGGGVYSWRMASSLPHAVGISHMLVEGNQGSGLEADIIHGSHNFITAYRNLYNGYQQNNGTNPSQNTQPIILMALNRFFNIVGNVLGSTTLPSAAYQSVNTSCSGPGTSPIYIIGGCESGSAATVNADSNVNRTLMRWGNYDVVTGAVRWCGNSSDTGWSTTCGSTTEIPSGITNYSNPVPIIGDTGIGQNAFPASFYNSSKPSWWPSAKSWPPIGPEVTGGNIAGYAGHAYSIPAADCYASIMGGSANGTGSVLTFNANTCYSGSTPQAATPTFTPVAGTYFNTQTVTITNPSGSPVMCYTTNSATPATNGSTGCTTGSVYSTAITVSVTETIKAVAGGTGYTDSNVGSASYTISVAAPTSLTVVTH